MKNTKKCLIPAFMLVGAITLAGCGSPSSQSLPQGGSDVTAKDQTAEVVEVEPEPEPVEVKQGPLDNPYPVGHVATIWEGDEDNVLFTLTATIKDGNAGAEIAQANSYNEPAAAGHHFVAIEYTLTGESKEEPTNVSWVLSDWSLSLDDATIIPEDSTGAVMPDGWNQVYEVNDLYAGQSGSVVVLYQVPDSYQGTLYATAYGSYITL
jgi:hypothetical protein